MKTGTENLVGRKILWQDREAVVVAVNPKGGEVRIETEDKELHTLSRDAVFEVLPSPEEVRRAEIEQKIIETQRQIRAYESKAKSLCLCQEYKDSRSVLDAFDAEARQAGKIADQKKAELESLEKMRRELEPAGVAA